MTSIPCYVVQAKRLKAIMLVVGCAYQIYQTVMGELATARTWFSVNYLKRSCTLSIAWCLMISSMPATRSWVTNCLSADLELIAIYRTQPDHNVIFA